MAAHCRRKLTIQLAMNSNNKRPATSQPLIAPRAFVENDDVMKCLILAVCKDNKKLKKEVDDLTVAKKYLKTQVDRLDGYTAELENRLDALSAVVTNLLNRGTNERDATEDIIGNLRATREYDMTDLDRIMFENDTETDEELAAMFEIEDFE